jgi:beta-lactamase class D
LKVAEFQTVSGAVNPLARPPHHHEVKQMTKAMITIFSALIALAISSPAPCEDSALAGLFRDRNVVGTIVLSDLDGSESYICNEHRANEHFVPASTFKILNTLIALDERVITEKEVIKWDGKDKGLKEWNRDQTIATAFRSSCVWFYQELARRIGTGCYKKYFNKASYGTGLPTPELTTFWLEGDLKISAVDQVNFLKKVYLGKLPFRDGSYEILRRLMVVEQSPKYTLRAKTGWAQRVAPQIGWYVGYVETGDKVWFFATNIEIRKPADAQLRRQLTMEALKLKGII